MGAETSDAPRGPGKGDADSVVAADAQPARPVDPGGDPGGGGAAGQGREGGGAGQGRRGSRPDTGPGRTCGRGRGAPRDGSGAPCSWRPCWPAPPGPRGSIAGWGSTSRGAATTPPFRPRNRWTAGTSRGKGASGAPPAATSCRAQASRTGCSIRARRTTCRSAASRSRTTPKLEGASIRRDGDPRGK